MNHMNGPIAAAREASNLAIERDVMEVAAKSFERADQAVSDKSASERVREQHLEGCIQCVCI